MKKILFLLMAVLTAPLALADYGHMMECKVTSNVGAGLYPLYGVVWFAVVAFISSLIFWGIYKLIVKEKPKRK